MSRRGRLVVVAALLVDGLGWLLTVHAQANFHSTPGGPATTLGIVLGWIVSIALLIGLILVALGALRTWVERRGWAERGDTEPRSAFRGTTTVRGGRFRRRP